MKNPLCARIGITSTIPSEVIYAAGYAPVDLNNVFINAEDPYALVEAAESDSFPRNYCAWMKGIYGALKANPEIQKIIGVIQGDCSNTVSLLDLLSHRGYEVFTFAYPVDASEGELAREIEKLCGVLGTTREDAEKAKTQLDKVRAVALAIDDLTWRRNSVTGRENHLALIETSDCRGNPPELERELATRLDNISAREPFAANLRLGLVGVPPIVSDLYEVVEGIGGRVVYNEVQREFAMPHGRSDLAGQYASYTYPYGAGRRAAEIRRQAKTRSLDGIIHYVQSFCYHQLDDIVIKETVGIPALTLEADKPGPLDLRSRLRLEAFFETLGG